MGNLSEDLDRFLKTEGVQMMMDAEKKSAADCEPLTEEDIEDLDSMILEGLDKAALEDLMAKAENLRDDLEDREPEDEDSEEYDLWEDRLCAVEDFIDRVGEMAEEMEGK